MATTITGLFETADKAAAAVTTLEARGIPAKDMSVVATEDFDRESFGVETHSKLPEGAAIGAAAGGATLALVAGLTSVGAIATGGAGLIAAGPLVAALAGAGAGAAGGSALGAAIGAAIPEHEVKHYEDAIEKGSVLVGVQCEDGDRKDTVKDVFKQFEAEKVSRA